jgi:hypothetical protein
MMMIWNYNQMAKGHIELMRRISFICRQNGYLPRLPDQFGEIDRIRLQ